MSLSQSNAFHARTKLIRPQGKPLGTASPCLPSTTSHVSLFLTNLRLLDLDLADDWPDITSATFSAKDAAGGQKRRIQCVEWALYRLFLLWDEEDALTKLRPFYPPLEQVQSINLRAALLRGLEQLKRNGVLGRDAVVRKTMLDECKGERLEEVLGVFSSAVLKKLVNERIVNGGANYHAAYSEKLALEDWGYSGDHTELNALILAHKIALRSALDDKNEARRVYRDFEELLALKERVLARRKERLKAVTEQEEEVVDDRLTRHTRQILKTNWTGNDKWLKSILYDDANNSRDGLLAADFVDVWTRVKDRRLFDLEDNTTGLPEQLEQRVRAQQTRLQKWERYRSSLFGGKTFNVLGAGKIQADADPPRGVDLGFRVHKELTASPLAFQAPLEIADTATSPGYAQLLQSLKTDISNSGKRAPPYFFRFAQVTPSHASGQGLMVPGAVREPISDLSEWEDEPEEAELGTFQPHPMQPAPDLVQTATKIGKASRPQATQKHPIIRKQSRSRVNEGRPQYFESRLEQQTDAIMPVASQPTHLPTVRSEQSAERLEYTEATLADGLVNVSAYDKRPSPPASEHSPPLLEDSDNGKIAPFARGGSPTQAMADEILAFVSNASPSPIKRARHTLSLEERTRMSMVRTRTRDHEEQFDLNLLSPHDYGINQKTLEAGVGHEPVGTDEDDEGLVARTRRSMAGFEAAKQKARLERRRSQRKSKAPPKKDAHFPRLEEEDEVGDASVFEDLLDAGAIDMEAVFKSRPKMRTSPAPSPGRRREDNESDS